MKVNGFRVMLVFVMYYIYVTSGPSLLIESTDSMIFVCNTSGIQLAGVHSQWRQSRTGRD